MNPIKKFANRWMADAKASPSTRYVDTCDGLRAVAVLIVGWYHIWQQSWLYPGFSLFGWNVSFDPLVRSGYMWVDMLILISGFCLYLPWARLRLEGGERPNTLDFYARRLMRVHPSYLLAVALMLAGALAEGSYGSVAHGVQDVAAHLTYTHTLFYRTYFDTKLGGALWTLGVEMQFYLLFPLFARAFTRWPLATFAGMCGASLAFRAALSAFVPDVGMYFNQLPAYLDVYACGMAAALIHVALSRRRHGALGRVLCSLGVLLLCAALWQVVREQAASASTEAIRQGQMDHRLMMGLLGGALLVFSAHAGWLLRHLLGNPLTRFVSTVSLQFYIWHQTLAVFIKQIRLIPSDYLEPNYEGDLRWQLAYTAACFLGAFALSALLTYGFERPVARTLAARWKKFRAGRG